MKFKTSRITVYVVFIQPVALTAVLENVNLCFAALFGVEMLLKVVGDGLYGYIRDGFNVFDGLIVLLRFVGLLFVTLM